MISAAITPLVMGQVQRGLRPEALSNSETFAAKVLMMASLAPVANRNIAAMPKRLICTNHFKSVCKVLSHLSAHESDTLERGRAGLSQALRRRQAKPKLQPFRLHLSFRLRR